MSSAYLGTLRIILEVPDHGAIAVDRSPQRHGHGHVEDVLRSYRLFPRTRKFVLAFNRISTPRARMLILLLLLFLLFLRLPDAYREGAKSVSRVGVQIV